MHEGTVTVVKLDRGFGFIKPTGGAKEIFFHLRDLDPALDFDETLQERRVRFDVQSSPKGDRAVGIQPAT